MKKVFILPILFLFVMMGCKKNFSDGSDNTWTLGSQRYFASIVIRGTNSLSAFDTIAHQAIIFAFNSSPSGTENTYLICDTCSNQNTAQVIAEDYPITTSSHNNYRNAIYVNTLTLVKASINAQGKLSVTFPGKLWVYNWARANDSLQLSVGTIAQQ